ncbi:hypothetical protein IX318_001203 [Porphyromonas levii]|nr:hypothetical protein [Porphyromonas levii]MBR8715345.1 hypothetical protein [Porphyromonas levii]MBR8736202.1 hypothetical protein [Porphyromonas levii]MBR8778511.1 hypothetical protein [Porphyromonas levii]
MGSESHNYCLYKSILYPPLPPLNYELKVLIINDIRNSLSQFFVQHSLIITTHLFFKNIRALLFLILFKVTIKGISYSLSNRYPPRIP